MKIFTCTDNRTLYQIVLSILVIVILAGANPIEAEVKPNALFSNGAVLQQGVTLPIWGTADEGESVTVKFQNQTAVTTATGGRWEVHFSSLKVGGPFSMTISGKNLLVLTNILVGEVWLCSGQSNMGMPLSAVDNASTTIAAAHDSDLRLFTVPRGGADDPKTDLSGEWKETSPEIVKSFSAVAYFFGRNLHKSLNVPIGLILSAVGGTPAEAWTPKSALEGDPILKPILDRQLLAVKKFELAKAKSDGKALSNVRPVQESPAVSLGRPAALYNAMITPLQPFALAGVIWYQGEQNRGRTMEYRTLFPSLIRSWRTAWGEGDFPFLFVQIAPYRDMPPELREAQLLTWQNLPRTAMVVTTDVGEENNIHPRQKEPIGARLALAARSIAYGQNIEYSGPVYDSMKTETNLAVLTFTHVGGGLISKGNDLKGFTIAGSDGKYMPATAKLDGDHIIVSSPSVAKPVSVRYGWANVPDGNLFNRQGLPATPFRTDQQ